MSVKFFLDTNIFIYTFDESAPQKSARALELIEEALTSRAGIISFQVVQEFFNIALKRFKQPLNLSEAEQYFSTTFRPLLAVHSSPALYLDALRVASRFHLSWYDSLVVASAQTGACDTLYTEDLQHGQRFGDLRIENPFQ